MYVSKLYIKYKLSNREKFLLAQSQFCAKKKESPLYIYPEWLAHNIKHFHKQRLFGCLHNKESEAI